MGLPGHRRTSSHKRRRAAHFALKKMQVTTCKRCQSTVLPHQTCLSCGTYAGRQVLNVARVSKRVMATTLAANAAASSPEDKKLAGTA
jgi:large subunit ribosomal protein L32